VTVRKRFGQHFLEPVWVARLVAAIAPQAGDVFLEIGPGRGALTRPLLEAGATVHAIEIDRDLVAGLRSWQHPRLTVHEGDALDLPTDAWFAGSVPYRVAANLPYNISTPILLRLFDEARAGHLRDATLMLQKEVVNRIVSSPGTKTFGPLAIAAAMEADVQRLFVLPPGAFRPPPAVDSAVVHCRFRSPHVTVHDRALFDQLVRHLFTLRRKTLGRALRPFADPRGLSATRWLAGAGLDAGRRAETLSLAELAALANAVTLAVPNVDPGAS
jgi:16S rRNA (adenine1518-N6/adenine1519-N6)-dimethyltransferase